MKQRLPLTVAVAALAGLSACPSLAEEQGSGFYFNAEAGVNFAKDVDGGVSGSLGSLSGKAELHTGTRFGAGVGYQLTRYLGFEFDTGWTWNQFEDSDSYLAHIPFLVNAVVRFPNTSRFEPYLGAGAGGAYSTLVVDEGAVEDDDADVGFAWQAMAGVRYRFKENMTLGLGYKYLNTSDTDYDIEGGRVKLDGTHNHSFGVVFNMSF